MSESSDVKRALVAELEERAVMFVRGREMP